MRAVGYHWAPTSRRAAIEIEGLRIGCQPAVNGVEDDHRNPWISLSPSPAQAWILSAGALAIGGFPSEAPAWDLWQADLTGVEVQRCKGDYPEVRSLQPVPPARLVWIASRPFPANSHHDRAQGGGVAQDKRCHSDEMWRYCRLPWLTRFTRPARILTSTRRPHPTAR
jgi:hypothetical protein